MIAKLDQSKSPERKVPPPRIKHYAGEAVFIYAFDVAYEMTRQPVRELLGQPVVQFVGAGVSRLGRAADAGARRHHARAAGDPH